MSEAGPDYRAHSIVGWNCRVRKPLHSFSCSRAMARQVCLEL